MFVIEDEIHAEWNSEYKTFEEAVEELKRLATIPWDKEPNQAPCTGWRTCGRDYEIVEYDNAKMPWNQIRRIPALSISSKGIAWSLDLNLFKI
jgi:hypothetical protein